MSWHRAIDRRYNPLLPSLASVQESASSAIPNRNWLKPSRFKPMQGKKFIGACRQGLRERFLGGSVKGVGIGTGQAGNPRDFTASFSGWERRGVFVDGGDDGIHAFLDFADLRMD